MCPVSLCIPVMLHIVWYNQHSPGGTVQHLNTWPSQEATEQHWHDLCRFQDMVMCSNVCESTHSVSSRFQEPCEIFKGLLWGNTACTLLLSAYMCRQRVNGCSPTENTACSALQRQTVWEAGLMAMLHLRCITLPAWIVLYPGPGLKWEHIIV